MGVPRPAPPALGIMAITAQTSCAREAIEAALAETWGAVRGCGPEYLFDAYTKYYAGEMGVGLVKWLVVFSEPVMPDALVDLKLASNAIEERWTEPADDGSTYRRVNLDPGYLTPSALVLASTKPAGHRIYLRDGIWAEITLHYEHGGWQPLPWTYPDFRQPFVHEFLSTWRRVALELVAGARAEPPAAAGD